MNAMRRRTPAEERSRILLAHLRSRDPKREGYVRTALAEMEAHEAVQMLLSWLRPIRKSERWYIPLVMVVGGAAQWAVRSVLTPPPENFMVGMFGGMIAMLPAALIGAGSMKMARNQTYRFLAQFDDLRIADALIEAMRAGDRPTQRAAEPTLFRLLSAFTPGDWHLLSIASRSFLNRRLLESSDPQLVKAILAAWEQIGNHDSIPYVDRLSHGEGVLGGDFTIRHAAAEALPAIREAANRTGTAETLLRAASRDETATTLLRPASSTESSEQALLRPAAD